MNHIPLRRSPCRITRLTSSNRPDYSWTAPTHRGGVDARGGGQTPSGGGAHHPDLPHRKGPFRHRRFDPWTQKSIYAYGRQDVSDDLPLPAALVDFLLHQVDRYGEASDGTLQALRYLREGLFRRTIHPSAARAKLDRLRQSLPTSATGDHRALQNFLQDFGLGGEQGSPRKP